RDLVNLKSTLEVSIPPQMRISKPSLALEENHPSGQRQRRRRVPSRGAVSHRPEVGLAEKFGQGPPHFAQQAADGSGDSRAQCGGPAAQACRALAGQVRKLLPDAERLQGAQSPLEQRTVCRVVGVIEARRTAVEGGQQSYLTAATLELGRHGES